jgi:hypothetical protein
VDFWKNHNLVMSAVMYEPHVPNDTVVGIFFTLRVLLQKIDDRHNTMYVGTYIRALMFYVAFNFGGKCKRTYVFEKIKKVI